FEAISLVFFFSSRRRHTRSDRDWSSDVCSSDLVILSPAFTVLRLARASGRTGAACCSPFSSLIVIILAFASTETTSTVISCVFRSEERRVGKECRSQRSTTL